MIITFITVILLITSLQLLLPLEWCAHIPSTAGQKNHHEGGGGVESGTDVIIPEGCEEEEERGGWWTSGGGNDTIRKIELLMEYDDICVDYTKKTAYYLHPISREKRHGRSRYAERALYRMENTTPPPEKMTGAKHFNHSTLILFVEHPAGVRQR